MSVDNFMNSRTKLPNPPFANLFAAAKLLGFFSLIVFLTPYQIFVKVTGWGDVFRSPRLFHGLLCRLIGLRPRVWGTPADGALGPVLFVSNHMSYLDILVLGSLLRGSFVAKSEVGSWPLIGTLARLQNTVFIERRAVRASTHRDVLREKLQEKISLVLFPEGTSSEGQRVLPFKSTLFSIVEKPLPDGSFVRVQPVSLACTEIGALPIGRSWRPYYGWYGDMTLVKHVWNVFKIGHFTVDVVFHQPVTAQEMGDRKALSAHCHRVVAKGLEQANRGRLEKDLAV